MSNRRQVEIPIPTVGDSSIDFFCKNRYAFYFGTILFGLLLFIIFWMNGSYRCWQWRTDPLAAAVVERANRNLPIPLVNKE